jgi:hypothetical protein
VPLATQNLDRSCTGGSHQGGQLRRLSWHQHLINNFGR